MTISPGTRLGTYEVTGLLGAGGMGQVYRARDTKLGRDVAVKIVTSGFDTDRTAAGSPTNRTTPDASRFTSARPNVNDGQWQISTSGGTRPLWAPGGQELFYFGNDGALMGARADTRGTARSAGTPTVILKPGFWVSGGANVGRTYDISPDGERFLMINAGSGSESETQAQIVVVKQWFEELKRLVPVE